MKKILIPINYQVVAVSQCEEIEGSQVLGTFDTEMQALNFESKARSEYWNLEIVKICSKCEDTLEECQCEHCHCNR